VPKLLFSPAAVVPTEDIPKVIAQAKAAAAESAIKLTVFQQDESVDEVPRGPQFEEEETPEVKEEVVEAKGEEPKLQEAKQEAAKPTDKPDVTDLVQKWAKKKG
jgi:hypothetical protein